MALVNIGDLQESRKILGEILEEGNLAMRLDEDQRNWLEQTISEVDYRINQHRAAEEWSRALYNQLVIPFDEPFVTPEDVTRMLRRPEDGIVSYETTIQLGPPIRLTKEEEHE